MGQRPFTGTSSLYGRKRRCLNFKQRERLFLVPLTVLLFSASFSSQVKPTSPPALAKEEKKVSPKQPVVPQPSGEEKTDKPQPAKEEKPVTGPEKVSPPEPVKEGKPAVTLFPKEEKPASSRTAERGKSSTP